MWWTNGFGVPPLLTTGPVGTPLAQAGVLGQPGTSVLIGDSREAGGFRSGMRFTLGGWFNQEQTCGLEASAFFLENRSDTLRFTSSGNPILAIPFFDANPTSPTFNQKTADHTAYPGVVSGTFSASTFSHVWGGDINFRHNLCCGCNCRVDALVGFRYLRLHETLTINDVEDFGVVPHVGHVRFDSVESFDTKNNFYGGQVGLAGEYWRDRCFVQLTGKMALGGNCRTVEVDGASIKTTGSLVQTFPQGTLFALRTNGGVHHDTVFSVIPELGLNVGIQLTSNLRVMVGYSFIACTNVARPGDQIDTTVNTSQRFGAPLVGAPRPRFQFQNSTFWAQGINFGLDLRF